MGESARIVSMVLFLSVVLAGPTGDSRKEQFVEDGDLLAEASEVTSSAVVPPQGTNYFQQREPVARAQSFFPSFASLFEPRQNNFRVNFGQEGAFSQRPNSYRSLLNYPLFGNYRSIDSYSGSKQSTAASAPLVDASASILGSGNFGIIKGGTFFAQNDEDDYESGDGFSSYYNNNNGHGRPSTGLGYIANPRPNYNQEQFANFRDFADINTPSNTAYSHYVVVYANKNSTADEVSQETRKVTYEPKNIIETLALLDNTDSDSKEVPPPKLSKSKSKLALTKHKYMKSKDQWKRSKLVSHKVDPEEPLLALS